jgi:hypothetical protein
MEVLWFEVQLSQISSLKGKGLIYASYHTIPISHTPRMIIPFPLTPFHRLILSLSLPSLSFPTEQTVKTPKARLA